MNSKLEIGSELYGLVDRLYPFHRSITGNGVRQTLKVLQEYIPLEIREVASGTPVFDWAVPDEWNVREAYVANSKGERIIDLKDSNLHLVHYSVPVKTRMGLAELKQHIFTLPDHPHWVPYRTSYHNRNWGFCMAHNCFTALEEDEYEVHIDCSLEPGSLTYGEFLVEGELEDEVLLSTHVCHPSLCNDNLSGIAIAALLARQLALGKPRYSYRFLFIPGTIGSITWLAQNKDRVHYIKYGLVLALLGDGGKFNYKKSRNGSAGIDRLVCRHLKEAGVEHGIIDFHPYGYDERQFCSPGFDLPVGSLTRTPHGMFPEYHTSADNLDFVKPETLAESFNLLADIIERIEAEEFYLNLKPECEPQLGKRGLYKNIGGESETKDYQMAVLWMLNMSDGSHSIQEIADRSDLGLPVLRRAVEDLLQTDLFEKLQ